MEPITCKAAVAWAAKQPLKIEEVIVDPPKAGEVRVRVCANALCHTDIYTLDGHDPEGLFPCILGHEAGAIVVDVGPGVTSVAPGDHVIPCYTPECREASCIFCASPKTNLCPKIRATQGKGVMPEGTSRFRLKASGETIYHFMGCSTFSEYTVISEISAAKIAMDAPLHKVCMLGCGVATGWGAAWNTSKVEAGSSVAVFGLGAVGLAVIQASAKAGAKHIVGIDLNPSKFELAKSFGATMCINPSEHESTVKALLSHFQWGIDFTFDCTGNTKVMRDALEAAHRGWGVSCVIGVAASGHEIATRPFQLVTGRVWKGTAFGGWKSRSSVPGLVDRATSHDMPIDKFITHTFDGLERTADAVAALHGGECLRAVVRYTPVVELTQLAKPVHVFGGQLKRFKHYSEACKCHMTFAVYLPPQAESRRVPALLYLSGLTCTDENVCQKSGFMAHAAKHGIAMICPDTSPRGCGIAGEDDSYDFGSGAGFYVDATAAPWSENYKMESYIIHELLGTCKEAFPLDGSLGIFGHSMGGHGALTLFLKYPNLFTSVSAFSPICNPTACPWGEKAFKGYLGSVEAGAAHDATAIIASGKFDASLKTKNILVDQGSADNFLSTQLHPEALKSACAAQGVPLTLRYHDGYDHSYYFIATFMGDHFAHHAKYLVPDCS